MKFGTTHAARLTGLTFACCLLFAVLLQNLNGAYHADIAGYDETAHYVTGLMVRQWLVSGEWFQPVQFARQYYSDYPRVAIGHWPPVFYVVQALWGLLFGAGKTSIIALMACIAAGAATMLYLIYSPELGRIAAGAVALTFLTLAACQAATSSVMAELPLLAGFLLAVFFYARYLETGRGAYCILFGLVAAATALTKANGLALALVPPVAVALTRQFYRVRTLVFWAPALIVMVLCGPWFGLTLPMAQEGYSTAKSPSGSFFLLVLQTNLRALYGELGVAIVLAAFAGIGLTVIVPIIRRQPIPAVWAVSFAAVLSVVTFHSLLLPMREVRHLIPALAMICGFAGAGVVRLAESAGPHRRKLAAWALSIAVLVWYAAGPFRLVPKPALGAGRAAELLTNTSHGASNILVASPDAVGEGAIIAEIALREPDPHRRIVRASKAFALQQWDGTEYNLRVRDEAEALRQINAERVQLILLADPTHSNEASPHWQLLQRVVDHPSGRMQRIFTEPDDPRYRIYRVEQASASDQSRAYTAVGRAR